jgi:HSP20 family molecular chaperone IbpA
MMNTSTINRNTNHVAIESWINPFKFEPLGRLQDRVANIFFELPAFSDLLKEYVEALDIFNNESTKAVYYGGDYLVTYNDATKDFNLFFLIPGHNYNTLTVNRRGKDLIIKSKNPTGYPYYKTIRLIKDTYVLISATCADGILNVTVRDKNAEAEEQSVEITPTGKTLQCESPQETS